jgi:hypothetical protein
MVEGEIKPRYPRKPYTRDDWIPITIDKSIPCQQSLLSKNGFCLRFFRWAGHSTRPKEVDAVIDPTVKRKDWTAMVNNAFFIIFK